MSMLVVFPNYNLLFPPFGGYTLIMTGNCLLIPLFCVTMLSHQNTSFQMIWNTSISETFKFLESTRKSTKYEAISTPNHCNGCSPVVTLGMEI